MKDFLKKYVFAVVLVPIIIIYGLWTNNNSPSLIEYFQEMGGKLLLDTEETCKYTYTNKYPNNNVYTEYEMKKKECKEKIVKATSQNKDMYIDCGYVSEEIVPVGIFFKDGVTREVPNRYGKVYRGSGSVPDCQNITNQKELEYRINYIEAYIDLYESCFKEHGKETDFNREEWVNCFTSERLYSKISIVRPPTYKEWLSSRAN